MTEVVAPPNVGTLPPIERVLEELHNEEASRVDVAGNETTAEDKEKEGAGLKVRFSNDIDRSSFTN